MANVKKIVQIINTQLNAAAFSDKRFQIAQLFDIAKSVPTKNKDKALEILPCIIDDATGEGKYLYPDDKHPVQVYHKMNSVSVVPDKVQYGNRNDIIVRTASMSMIVFGMRTKLQLSDQDLELIISASLINKLSKAQLADLTLKDCTIQHTATDFNSLGVYQKEYSTKEYYLKPTHLFFEMKYTIECKLDKSCINTCSTC